MVKWIESKTGKNFKLIISESQWQSGVAATICQGGPGSNSVRVKNPSMRKKKMTTHEKFILSRHVFQSTPLKSNQLYL